jgi:hypothetical protein
MSHCLAPASLSLNGSVRWIAIAGCRVDLSLAEAADGAGASAEAARLAEQLVATRTGCDLRMVRVAALMPSGRPVATVEGRGSGVCVSVSHSGTVIGAAICSVASVGLDIVDPSAAGPPLDAWFTPGEAAHLPGEDGLVRARLWAAKEAAFKAARLDEGFRPRAIEIESLDRIGFSWRVRGDRGPVCGQGIFTVAGGQIVAVAVAPNRFAAAGYPPASTPGEVIACS